MGINRTDRSLRIADLISRQKAEGLSTDEQNELDSLLNKEPALQHLMDEFQAHHQVYKELELMNSFDPEVKLGDYQKRFYNRRKTWMLWPRIAAAAAAAAMIFGAGLFLYHQQQNEREAALFALNEVSPGKQGATLTLASGKRIRLTEAAGKVLAVEAGVVNPIRGNSSTNLRSLLLLQESTNYLQIKEKLTTCACRMDPLFGLMLLQV